MDRKGELEMQKYVKRVVSLMLVVSMLAGTWIGYVGKADASGGTSTSGVISITDLEKVGEDYVLDMKFDGEDTCELVPTSGSAALEEFKIIDDRTVTEGNKVFQIANVTDTTKTTYTPSRWNDKYEMKSFSLKLDVSTLRVQNNHYPYRIVLWQDPQNPLRRATMLLGADTSGTSLRYPVLFEMTNTEGNACTPQWPVDTQAVRTENDKWLGVEVTYTDAENLKVVLRNEDTDTDLKTYSWDICDWGMINEAYRPASGTIDIRKGYFGIQNIPKDLSTTTGAIDDIQVVFDHAAVDAENFAKTYADLLKLTGETFGGTEGSEYSAACDKLKTALAAYEMFEQDVKNLLVEEKMHLDTLEVVRVQKLREVEATPFTKDDLNENYSYTWDFDNDDFLKFAPVDGHEDVEDFKIVDNNGNKVFQIPYSTSTVTYSPLKWNDNYSMKKIAMDIDMSQITSASGKWVYRIVLWQDASDPTKQVVFRWHAGVANDSVTLRYGADIAISTAKGNVSGQWYDPAQLTRTQNDGWVHFEAEYLASNQIKIKWNTDTNDKECTVNFSTDYRFEDRWDSSIDVRKGSFGIQNVHEQSNVMTAIDNLTVTFDNAVIDAEDFKKVHAEVLTYNAGTFGALTGVAYDNACEKLAAAIQAYNAYDSDVQAQLTTEKNTLDALEIKRVEKLTEAASTPFTKADLTNYTYTWNFNNDTFLPFGPAGGGLGVEGFEIVDDRITTGNGNKVFQIPYSDPAVTYSPLKWNNEYLMKSVTMKVDMSQVTSVSNGSWVYNMVLWQDPKYPLRKAVMRWSIDENGARYAVRYELSDKEGNTAGTWGGDPQPTRKAEDKWINITVNYVDAETLQIVWADGAGTQLKTQDWNLCAWGMIDESVRPAAGDVDVRRGTFGIGSVRVQQSTKFAVDDITVTFDETSVDGQEPLFDIDMVQGAYLRTKAPLGIRFGANIAVATDRITTEKILGYGILILPEDKLGSNELTVAFADLNTTPVSGVTAAHSYKALGEDEDLPANAYGSLIGIEDTLGARALVARVYVKYQDASGQEQIAYSNLSTSRSLYQTAMLAVNAYCDTDTTNFAGVTKYTEDQMKATSTSFETDGQAAIEILRTKEKIAAKPVTQ